MVRALPLVATTVLALTALAGCLAGPGPSTPAEATDLEETLGLSTTPQDEAPDGDRAAWYLLEGRSGPDGRVTTYAWSVPPDTHAVDVLPLAPDRTRSGLTSWGILKFRGWQGKAVLSGGYLHPTVEVVSRALLSTDDPETLHPSMEPFRMDVSAPADERIALLLAARSDDPGGFAVAIRPINRTTDLQTSVPDLDEMHDHVRTSEGVRLGPIGRASGFRVPGYAEFNRVGNESLSMQTDAVTVRETAPVDARPTASVREVEIVSDFDVRTGWGVALGSYVNAVGGGTWKIDATMHGHNVSAHSPMTVPTNQTRDVLGLPAYLVTGGGEGPSHVEFRLRTTNANVDEQLAFLQVDIGATMNDLLGGPGVSLTLTSEGEAGLPGTTIQADDGDLVVHGDGIDLRVANLAPYS